MEEVEWESDATGVAASSTQAGPQAVVTVTVGKTRAAASRGLELIRWLVRPASSVVRRGAAAAQDRPAVAAVAAFALALPLLLLALGGGEEVKAVARSEEDAIALARRRAAALLGESQAHFSAGNTQAAQAALHQADLLFPVSPQEGMSRILLAAEREVDRLDRVDEAVEEAHLEIARADFEGARVSIGKLTALEAPQVTIRSLESSLAEARRRVRRAQKARTAALDPVVVTPAPTPEPVRVVSVPKPAPKTGPGTLRIEFTSARPRGALMVLANEKQVLKRSFRFVEKKNFLVRKGVSGSFHESIELPEGAHNLRLYLSQRKLPTQHRLISVEIPPGDSTTLRLRVQADGKFVVGKG
jgi:hypothetical protein